MRTEDVSVTTMNNLEIVNNLIELIEHPLCIDVAFSHEEDQYLVEVWHETEGPALYKAATLAEALWDAVEKFKSLSAEDEE